MKTPPAPYVVYRTGPTSKKFSVLRLAAGQNSGDAPTYVHYADSTESGAYEIARLMTEKANSRG